MPGLRRTMRRPFVALKREDEWLKLPNIVQRVFTNTGITQAGLVGLCDGPTSRLTVRGERSAIQDSGCLQENARDDDVHRCVRATNQTENLMFCDAHRVEDVHDCVHKPVERHPQTVDVGRNCGTNIEFISVAC
eukprot:651549-Prorocentrum_minimum.AAC.2